MKIQKLGYTFSIGFCDPYMKINVDPEYEVGFIGMYKLSFSFESLISFLTLCLLKKIVGEEVVERSSIRRP